MYKSSCVQPPSLWNGKRRTPWYNNYSTWYTAYCSNARGVCRCTNRLAYILCFDWVKGGHFGIHVIDSYTTCYTAYSSIARGCIVEQIKLCTASLPLACGMGKGVHLGTTLIQPGIQPIAPMRRGYLVVQIKLCTASLPLEWEKAYTLVQPLFNLVL